MHRLGDLRVSPSERVWHQPCATSFSRTHIHLGDGTFEGSLAGAGKLEYGTNYALRVRFQDDTTLWSDWAERLFSTSAAGPPGVPGPVPWQTEPGYTVEVVAGGFALPVAIAPIPSPGAGATAPVLYVGELYGTIKVVRQNGTVSTYATNLLNFNPGGSFPGSGEIGLGALTIEPTSGDVLASILYQDASAGNPIYAKVIRLHSTDGGLTAASQSTILDLRGEIVSSSHQISNVTIGPDGMVYVHNGESFTPRRCKEPGLVARQDPPRDAERVGPDRQPVLQRRRRDHCPRLHLGVRLPQPVRGRLAPEQGARYVAENGPTLDRITRLVKGRDYGWDGTAASFTNYAIYNWIPAHAPVNADFVDPTRFNGSGFPGRQAGSPVRLRVRPDVRRRPAAAREADQRVRARPSGRADLRPDGVRGVHGHRVRDRGRARGRSRRAVFLRALP